MMKPLCSALAAATLLAATTPTFAEGAGGRGGEDTKARIARRVDTVFARLDADKDGRISRAEVAKRPRLSRHFDKVDADHDGYVSRAELSAAIERHAQR
jgi:Ca2+-binding EF-hand superfamily protein